MAPLSTSLYPTLPFVPQGAEGAWLFGEGRRVLDLTAGWGTLPFGYGEPVKGTEPPELVPPTLSAPEAEALAAELSQALGGGYRVLFETSEEGALEAALKLVRYHTRRPYLVALAGSDYGATLAALSLSGRAREGFSPLCPGVFLLTGRRPEEELGHLFKTTLPPGEVAALVAAPFATRDPLGHGPEALAALKPLLTRHGIPLVVTEAEIGLGRTGSLFAHEKSGVRPDLLVLGRGLAPGFPLAALVYRVELSSWPPGSHQNPFAHHRQALAQASWALSRYRELGPEIERKSAQLAEALAPLGEVRARGLWLWLKPKRPQEDPLKQALAAGVLVRPGPEGGLLLTPPLTLRPAEIEEAARRLGLALG